MCILFNSHLKSTEHGNEIMDYVLAFLSGAFISKAEQVFGSYSLLMIDSYIADVTPMFHGSGNENYVCLFSVLLALSFSLFSFSYCLVQFKLKLIQNITFQTFISYKYIKQTRKQIINKWINQ